MVSTRVIIQAVLVAGQCSQNRGFWCHQCEKKRFSH